MEEAIISAFPERIKLEAVTRRNLTGMTLIRSSLSSLTSEKNLLPRYLRASTSSCHDFCKYGRKHDFEAETESSVTRKVVRNVETASRGQGKAEDRNVRERKNTAVIKLKFTVGPKTKLADRPQIIEKKAPSPIKKIDISAKPSMKPKPNPRMKPASAITSSPSSSPRVGPSATRRYSGSPVPGSAGSCSKKKPLCSLGGLSSRRGSDSSTVKNTKSPKMLQSKELKRQTSSLSPKPSVNGFSSIKSFKYGNSKLASTANNHDKRQRSQFGDDTEKTIYAIEPVPDKSSLELVQHESYSPQSLSPPSLMSLSLPSILSSSSLSSEGAAADTKEEVKEVKEERKDVEDVDEGEEVYDSSLDEADYSDSEHDGAEKDQGEALKGSQGRQSRLMVDHADQDCLPHKLKFRRGRVINPQLKHNSPRRLSFRQGRVVGNASNGKPEARKRSYKMRELVGSGDSSSKNAEASVIILRHQDVCGKKEEQGLFNEVIEVTASKLAETRKSKVKALVGAFETVISLQDNKPVTAV